MRLIPLLYLCLLFNAVFAQDIMESIIKSEAEATQANWDFKAKKAGDTYDIVYQHLFVKVNPAVRYIEGEVFSHFVSKQAGFSELRFDMDNRMTVDSVKYQNASISFTHINDQIVIGLPALALDQLDSIRVYYRGNPSQNPLKGFYYDNHATGPIAWTLSEPYGAYIWWPCKQQLADKIDSFDMSVQVPVGNKVAGLGLLQSVDTLSNTDLVFHWKHRHPLATYLVALAVTNYQEFTHYAHFSDGDSMPVLEYMYPEFMQIADTQAYRVEPMLRLFDSLCGPYPFRDEKYGHAQWGRGGGMEHQTMSFMSDLDFTLMAHELAHQWYGDKITCGSWQDIWLNESFATFFTAVAIEHLGNSQEWENYMTQQLNRATSANGGSVFVYDTTSVSRIFSGRLTYSKGCFVIQMLRWKLGDDDFFSAIRQYTADADLCYGFATTSQFQDALEQVSGMDLDEFFDLWVYKEGFPLLTITWNRKNLSRVSIDIAQVPSDNSVEFFPLDIEFRMRGDQGQDTLISVAHRKLSEVFDVNLGFKVTSVEYDPRIWLLAKTTFLEGNHEDFTSIAVFPNPNHGSVELYIQDKRIDQVQLYDRLGRLVLSEFPASKKNVPVQIRHQLARGIYMVKIRVGEETVVSKMVVK